MEFHEIGDCCLCIPFHINMYFRLWEPRINSILHIFRLIRKQLNSHSRSNICIVKHIESQHCIFSLKLISLNSKQIIHLSLIRLRILNLLLLRRRGSRLLRVAPARYINILLFLHYRVQIVRLLPVHCVCLVRVC